MLEWLSTLPHAALLRRWDTAYVLVNSAHIAAIGIVFGSIAALDLRLLGLSRRVPLAGMAPYLAGVAAVGVGLALVSGLWLFSVQPVEYANNPAFLIKLLIVALAIANALWLHAGRHWRGILGDDPLSSTVRCHAAASLILWLAAIVAGRWIGFI